MLAKRNEKAIYLDPVFLRKLRLELPPNLIGAAGSDIPPPYGDTRNVNIDADPLLSRRHPKREVRGYRMALSHRSNRRGAANRTDA